MTRPALLLLLFSFAPSPAAALPAVERPATPVQGIVKYGHNIQVGPRDVVDGPVVALMGSVGVQGRVDGPVVALGGSVRVDPGARIEGPVVVLGGTAAVDGGASVDGPVVQLPGTRFFAQLAAVLVPLIAATAALAVAAKILAGLGWIVLAVFLWLLFPEGVRNTRDALRRDLPACFLLGLAAWPGVAMVALALLVSLIGIPLLPLVAMGAVAAYAWGFCGVSYFIGSRLTEERWGGPLGAIVVGALLLNLLRFIPVLHWIAAAAVAALGLGAILVSRFGTRRADDLGGKKP